jgi:hypothetical protein
VSSHPIRYRPRDPTLFALNAMPAATTYTVAVLTRHPLWSKPDPMGSWEQLALRQLRLRRMVFLLVQGYSYRAVAREMGLAVTTVRRMAPEAARLSAFADVLSPISFDASDRADTADGIEAA